MSRRYAPIGVMIAFAACATAVPAPEGADNAPPQATADVASPQSATTSGEASADRAAGNMSGMGAQHRERMRAEMGDGMHQGQGMHRGEGMHQGEGQGMHRGEGMHQGEGQGMRMRMGMGMGSHEAGELRQVPAEFQEGERVFREICSACHTMDPPPNLAPPMSHVARHLRSAFDDQDAAVGHVVGYVPAPDAERSILPAMAVERFGLMPAQTIPEELLQAVGRYLWFLGSPQ